MARRRLPMDRAKVAAAAELARQLAGRHPHLRDLSGPRRAFFNALRPRPPAAPPPAPLPAAPTIGLDVVDGLILRALAGTGLALKMMELAARADLDRGTCGSRLPALEEAGLVHRLSGRKGRKGRRGVTITPAGRAALAGCEHTLPRDPLRSHNPGS